jgi:hypothetical protein
MVHCKKRLAIIKLFPARESLVGDIPAGDGKFTNPFSRVCTSILKTNSIQVIAGTRKE